MSKEKLEQLYLRSDGIAETRSGLFAVRMLKCSGVVDGLRFFSYRPTFNSDTKTVMWPEENSFALFPSATATGLMNKGYAGKITQDEVDSYNEQLGVEPDEDSEDEDHSEEDDNSEDTQDNEDEPEEEETSDETEEEPEGEDEPEEEPATTRKSRRNRKKNTKGGEN